MDPLKYIFQKTMPTGKLAKWQMLLSEFDIVYVTQKAIKALALADHSQKIPLIKSMNRSRLIFTMKKYHLWVKIFLKRILARDYSLMERLITKEKNYLYNPPVLVPLRDGSPLLLHFSISDNAFGCVLGQHDETGKKERAIYYISKKFTPYESRYTLLERTCCGLTWIAQKLRHYLSSYTTYLICRIDLLKYIFHKAMPTEKLAKWQMLLSEFDIVYVTQKAIKAQALADHLAENPIDEEVANHQGKGIRAVLVSESGQHYPMADACAFGLKMAIVMNVHELLVIGDSDLLIQKVQAEWAVKKPNITPYVQYIQTLCRRFRKIEFRHTPRTQNELADALTTIASMI
ncbi:uncharacterized protein LOC114078014 [Solanum pennellii]|uniref:Uncharacterized protein LOC114078014 n=1 Tax=Solanum pennellii TaxID=28526 RepID=A0ABM1VEZ3_SOLPN|nr:uncharacterized protein LOC114078014 [Solanum pennellii]